MISFKEITGFLSLAVFAILCGCSERTTNPIELREFTDRQSGIYFMPDMKAVVISNPLGPVRVDGLGNDSTVRWFLQKSVHAETGQQATPIFADIFLKEFSVGDTLFLDVATSRDQRGIAALVSLSLPFRTCCVIAQVLGTTQVSYLGGDVHGQALSATTVEGQAGSVFLYGSGGDISVDVELPDSGQCIIHSLRGSIFLRIPQSTSAQLFASAPTGWIAHYGLQFTGIVSSTTSFSGRLGTARGTIQLSTDNGNITVHGF
jgi:hypothetical protein